MKKNSIDNNQLKSNDKKRGCCKASLNGGVSLLIDNLVTKTTGISQDDDSLFEPSKAKNRGPNMDISHLNISSTKTISND